LLIFVLLPISIITINGCNNNGTDPEDNDTIPDPVDNPLWPFNVGDWWEIMVWDNEGSHPETTFEYYEVDSVFGFSDERVARIRFSLLRNDTLFSYPDIWWGNTEEGLYMFGPYGNEFEPYDSPRLLFKHPAIDGDAFDSYALDDPGVADEMLFFDMGIPPIEVPAGTFDLCVGFQVHQAPATDYYYYFQPDMGYISMEKYNGSSLVKTKRLSDYFDNDSLAI